MLNLFQILMPGIVALSLCGDRDKPSISGFNFMEMIINTKRGKGQTVLYDECDHDFIAQHTWHLTKSLNGYVRTTISLGEGIYKTVTLHRHIMGAKRNELVDHKNGNTLDNRRANLRTATPSQNSINRKPAGRSRYLGVCLSTYRNKWQAQINVGGKCLHLGRFADEIQAAKAYDNAAKLYHGEFARLNFDGL